MARVLVVDDAEDMRLMMRTVLERAGHEVAEAAGGWSAIEALVEQKPDAIVLDITLGDIEGMAVLRRARAKPQCRNVPIIVVSGHTTKATMQEAEEAGASAYLTKPFSNEDLEQTVARLLER
jgi:CheY-like chemotaxis protein